MLNLLLLMRGKSVCTFCPATERRFGSRRWERERKLGSEEYACELKSGYVVKSSKGETTQDMGRKLGRLYWEKIHTKTKHRSLGNEAFLGLPLIIQCIGCVVDSPPPEMKRKFEVEESLEV